MRSLEELFDRTVRGLGYELADFEISNHGKMLRVFIDKIHETGPGSQITLADCEAVSRQLMRVLEVEGVGYDRLEVSSPGLDRRLKKAADFARFTGSKAEVRLREPLNGRRRFVGIVRGIRDEQVELESEGTNYLLALSNLDRARLVPQVMAGGRK
ncbi:MAG: ribosome maturation factor RimP [Betaproteobacteria bacterium]|nr:ribosome maturation factor RimP [Betaproteobacteria bacterium]MBI2960158.1 ribosome maturation factor RimP [Betaproteobacteria bacterium]